jgi:hypothetical protein
VAGDSFAAFGSEGGPLLGRQVAVLLDPHLPLLARLASAKKEGDINCEGDLQNRCYYATVAMERTGVLEVALVTLGVRWVTDSEGGDRRLAAFVFRGLGHPPEALAAG